MLLSFESDTCTCNIDIVKDDKFPQYPHKVHLQIKVLTVYFLLKYLHMVNISSMYFLDIICLFCNCVNKTTNLYFEVNDLKRTK